MTSEVIEMVLAKFPDNPGDLRQFRLAVTKTDAGRQFDWFVENALGNFGAYQDALVEESPVGVPWPHFYVSECRSARPFTCLRAGRESVA
jgi:deoxyribodipyrimidine photolyase-like uncharacterized protein